MTSANGSVFDNLMCPIPVVDPGYPPAVSAAFNLAASFAAIAAVIGSLYLF